MTSTSQCEDTQAFIPLKPPTTSMTEQTKYYDFVNDINLEDLDLTNETEEIDLSGIEANLNAFQEIALDNNVNLGNYSKKIESDLKNVEIASIRDYIENSESLVALHESIENADGLLESMGNMLSGFQNHLEKSSGKIQGLQDQLKSMDIELQHRKQTGTMLNKYVNELEITSEFIHNITHFPVGKDYIQYLIKLNEKIQFHQSLDHEWTAYQDIATKLVTLQNRATLRIRSFLIQQFNGLSVPKTNIALKQQHLLLFEYFMRFLEEINDRIQNMKSRKLKRQNSYSTSSSIISIISNLSNTFDDDTAGQLRIYYIDLMSNVYMTYFRNYTLLLTKHRETEVADKTDLLALNVGTKKGLFSSKKSVQYLNNVFILGDRINVLQNFKNEPVIILETIDINDRFQYEEIFKSFLRLLTDATINEYNFLLQFFHEKNMFNKIFDNVFSAFLEEFDVFRQCCYDSIGLLLMIRINEMIHGELEDAEVMCLESFFDKINMIFWPRFNIIFDCNIKSIKECEPTKNDIKYLRQERAALNTPHFITIRVSSYITAILILNIDKKQQILTLRINHLRIEFEKLLSRFAHKIDDKMSRIIWLINNYSIIIATMNKEINILRTDIYQIFNDKLNKLCQQYIEDELKHHLFGWIEFILNNDKTKMNMTQIKSIAIEFKSNWKDKLKIAMNNIKTNFVLNVDSTIIQQIGENELFQNQKEIKKKFLQKLLIYHSRFLNKTKNIKEIQSLIVPINTMKYQVKAFWDV